MTPVPTGIDAAPVSAWLADNVDRVQPPFTFELIAGGHSNLTYKVTGAGGEAVVLRRPPLGHVLATAHDMAREHKIISGVGQTGVPVPEALGVCEDEAVNGAPFYVMTFVEGDVLHDDKVAAAVPEAERAALGVHVAEVLAELHAVEPEAVGLGDLGRREAYIARQLTRWTRQWEQSKTRELPQMEATQATLERTMPEQVGAAIVHGDYRLGNMITGEGRIRAVLDWELCTLGDPMADVGYLVNNWVEPGDAQTAGSSSPTLAGGFGTRDEILARYQELSGRDVSRVGYYRAFSYWRLAAICEGVYRRYKEGVMSEVDEAELDLMKQRTEDLANAAVDALAETS
jgi:aminoglycoside phosphotransferase (APT) family kinase protein